MFSMQSVKTLPGVLTVHYDINTKPPTEDTVGGGGSGGSDTIVGGGGSDTIGGGGGGGGSDTIGGGGSGSDSSGYATVVGGIGSMDYTKFSKTINTFRGYSRSNYRFPVLYPRANRYGYEHYTCDLRGFLGSNNESALYFAMEDSKQAMLYYGSGYYNYRNDISYAEEYCIQTQDFVLFLAINLLDNYIDDHAWGLRMLYTRLINKKTLEVVEHGIPMGNVCPKVPYQPTRSSVISEGGYINFGKTNIIDKSTCVFNVIGRSGNRVWLYLATGAAYRSPIPEGEGTTNMSPLLSIDIDGLIRKVWGLDPTSETVLKQDGKILHPIPNGGHTNLHDWPWPWPVPPSEQGYHEYLYSCFAESIKHHANWCIGSGMRTSLSYNKGTHLDYVYFDRGNLVIRSSVSNVQANLNTLPVDDKEELTIGSTVLEMSADGYKALPPETNTGFNAKTAYSSKVTLSALNYIQQKYDMPFGTTIFNGNNSAGGLPYLKGGKAGDINSLYNDVIVMDYPLRYKEKTYFEDASKENQYAVSLAKYGGADVKAYLLSDYTPANLTGFSLRLHSQHFNNALFYDKDEVEALPIELRTTRIPNVSGAWGQEMGRNHLFIGKDKTHLFTVLNNPNGNRPYKAKLRWKWDEAKQSYEAIPLNVPSFTFEIGSAWLRTHMLQWACCRDTQFVAEGFEQSVVMSETNELCFVDLKNERVAYLRVYQQSPPYSRGEKINKAIPQLAEIAEYQQKISRVMIRSWSCFDDKVVVFHSTVQHTQGGGEIFKCIDVSVYNNPLLEVQ